MKPTVELRPSWACALAPWAFLILLTTVILHLRLGLGRFPKPMWDDYLTPAFRLHSSIVHASGVLSALTVPVVWLALQWFPRFRAPTPVFLRQIAVTILGWAVFFAFAIGDPWRLVSWYLD
jgi:hypothetical protein